jgi:methyltransferase family protein
MDKYEAEYSHCARCDYLQIDDPFWLEEAYRDPIGVEDTGYIMRNQFCAVLAASLLHDHFDENGQCVDYGGGYGMFVQMMISMGYRFKWSDKYCPNLFAKGAEWDGKGPVELMTCFETFEHFVEPMREIDRMMAVSDSVLLSTVVRSSPGPDRSWSYYAPEGGQHIGLFSVATLKFVAETCKLNLFSDSNTFHLLTRRPLRAFSQSLAYGWKRWTGVVQDALNSSLPATEFRAILGSR